MLYVNYILINLKKGGDSSSIKKILVLGHCKVPFSLISSLCDKPAQDILG